MRPTIAVAMLLISAMWLRADEPPFKKRAVALYLPRFANQAVELEAVEKALQGIPSVRLSYTGVNILDKGKPHYMQIGVEFDPTKADLGDIAKALGKLGGDKTQAVAAVSMAQVFPIKEEQFASLKKELATAKGIDWKRSDRNLLALDESGGAKFEEIRAAYKKAGVKLITGLDDQ